MSLCKTCFKRYCDCEIDSVANAWRDMIHEMPAKLLALEDLVVNADQLYDLATEPDPFKLFKQHNISFAKNPRDSTRIEIYIDSNHVGFFLWKQFTCQVVIARRNSTIYDLSRLGDSAVPHILLFHILGIRPISPSHYWLTNR